MDNMDVSEGGGGVVKRPRQDEEIGQSPEDGERGEERQAEMKINEWGTDSASVKISTHTYTCS